MRSLIIFGLIGLPLAACTLKINEVTEGASASATDSGMSSTSTSSTGDLPTTTDAQGTSQAGTDAVSTGVASTGVASTSEATGTTGNSSASPSTGELTDGTTAGTSGGLDMGGPVAHATVENSCAPDDGPALEFHFVLTEAVCGADWSGDVLRVMLFQGGPLAPGEYTLAGGKGFAWRQQDGMPEEVSTEGTITIDGWDGDVVTGFFDLQWAEAVTQGDFSGPHCPTGGFCG